MDSELRTIAMALLLFSASSSLGCRNIRRRGRTALCVQWNRLILMQIIQLVSHWTFSSQPSLHYENSKENFIWRNALNKGRRSINQSISRAIIYPCLIKRTEPINSSFAGRLVGSIKLNLVFSINQADWLAGWILDLFITRKHGHGFLGIESERGPFNS